MSSVPTSLSMASIIKLVRRSRSAIFRSHTTQDEVRICSACLLKSMDQIRRVVVQLCYTFIERLEKIAVAGPSLTRPQDLLCAPGGKFWCSGIIDGLSSTDLGRTQ